jgi:hypothetical protein
VSFLFAIRGSGRDHLLFGDSHSSFLHLLFNCMALTSFGTLALTESGSEIHLTLFDPQHRPLLLG